MEYVGVDVLSVCGILADDFVGNLYSLNDIEIRIEDHRDQEIEVPGVQVSNCAHLTGGTVRRHPPPFNLITGTILGGSVESCG